MAEIIAEVGQNYNGNIQLALKLIKLACTHGADVVKFQLYDENLTCAVTKPLKKSELKEIKQYCDELGIEFLVSVFSPYLVDWTEEVGVDRYKIASRSIYDFDLVKTIFNTNKPVIASLGKCGSTLPKNFPRGNVKFLYCIMEYPTVLNHIMLPNFGEFYHGFSDHSIGLTAAITSIVMGASIVEKHFTLDKSMDGPDHVCSMVPEELKQIVIFNKELGEMQKKL